jgi:hypothetical protein
MQKDIQENLEFLSEKFGGHQLRGKLSSGKNVFHAFGLFSSLYIFHKISDVFKWHTRISL